MFEKIELEVNQRSKDDPVHSEVIAGMRDVTRAINLPAILNLYSRIDVTNPKNNVGFEDAIIAVAGNDEGHAVNDVRGKDFALKHGKPIVKWRKQPSGKSRPLKNTPRFEELYENNASVIGTFIESAPCFLTRNLNVSLKLANGSRAALHSLILGSARIEEAARIAACLPGETVWIEEPVAVNVVIPNTNVKHWPVGATIIVDGEKVVIPLTTTGNSRKHTKLRLPNLKDAIEFINFPFDLGFARTYHKLYTSLR
jgi:hypothetical protein